jgi:hypothetical protein
MLMMLPYHLSICFDRLLAVQTNIGTILISVNPFKRLPLYTPTVMDQYMHKGTKEMPPHTYNIADDAYRAMIDNRINQVTHTTTAIVPLCLLACFLYALSVLEVEAIADNGPASSSSLCSPF